MAFERDGNYLTVSKILFQRACPWAKTMHVAVHLVNAPKRYSDFGIARPSTMNSSDERGEATVESGNRPDVRLGAPRILIADDSDAVRAVIRKSLERLTSFNVCGEAIDGADAVSKAKELTPDLVILDIRMPHLTGIEVAAILRNSMPTIRIILISMFDDVIAEKLMSTLHVDAVLSKSEGIVKLIERVESLLSGQPFGPC